MASSLRLLCYRHIADKELELDESLMDCYVVMITEGTTWKEALTVIHKTVFGLENSLCKLYVKHLENDVELIDMLSMREASDSQTKVFVESMDVTQRLPGGLEMFGRKRRTRVESNGTDVDNHFLVEEALRNEKIKKKASGNSVAPLMKSNSVRHANVVDTRMSSSHSLLAKKMNTKKRTTFVELDMNNKSVSFRDKDSTVPTSNNSSKFKSFAKGSSRNFGKSFRKVTMEMIKSPTSASKNNDEEEKEPEIDVGQYINQVCNIYQYYQQRPAEADNIFPPMIINPENKFKLMWNIMILALVMFYSCIVPVRLAFDLVLTERQIAVDQLADCLFIIDVIMNFRTAYKNKNNVWVVDAKKIKRKYLKTWAAIDILASIPISLVIGSNGSEVSSSAVSNINNLLRSTRLFKMFRMFLIFRFISSFESIFRLNPSLLRFVKAFTGLLGTWHLIGCFYWYIAIYVMYGGIETCCYELDVNTNLQFISHSCNDTLTNSTWNCFKNECIYYGDCAISDTDSIFLTQMTYPDVWVPHNELANATLSTQYLQAVFWALEVTTSIGGDIIPKTTLETCFTILSSVFGLMVYSWLIGAASSAFRNMDSVSITRKDKLVELNSYFRKKKVPQFMINTIINYYEHVWTSKSDAIPELDLLPATLKLRLSLVLNKDLFSKVALFQKMDISEFLKLIQLLRPSTYLPGEYIVVVGEVCSSMYFIERGKVEVLALKPNTDYDPASADEIDDSKFQVVALRGAGDYFGERSLLAEKNVLYRSASIRAVTYCDMLKLTRVAFDTACKSKTAILKALEAEDKERTTVLNAVLKNSKLSKFMGVLDYEKTKKH